MRGFVDKSKVKSGDVTTLSAGIYVRQAYQAVRILYQESNADKDAQLMRFAIEMADDRYNPKYRRGLVLEVREGAGRYVGDDGPGTGSRYVTADVEIGTQLQLGHTSFAHGVEIGNNTISKIVDHMADDHYDQVPYLEAMHSDELSPLEKLADISETLMFKYLAELNSTTNNVDRATMPRKLVLIAGISAAAREALKGERLEGRNKEDILRRAKDKVDAEAAKW